MPLPVTFGAVQSVSSSTSGTDTLYAIPDYVIARMRAGVKVKIVGAYIAENPSPLVFDANPTQPLSIEVIQNSTSLSGRFIVSSYMSGSPLAENPVVIQDIPLYIRSYFVPGTDYDLCIIFALDER